MARLPTKGGGNFVLYKVSERPLGMAMSTVLHTETLLKAEPGERARLIREFIEAKPKSPNGAKAKFDEKIAQFEREFGMTSDTFRELIAAKKISETDLYCQWLILLQVRDRLANVRK